MNQKKKKWPLNWSHLFIEKEKTGKIARESVDEREQENDDVEITNFGKKNPIKIALMVS